MQKRTKKIKYPSTIAQFDPSTDKPLRYFSTKQTFVRRTSAGSYKLFCDGYHVLMLSYDGFIYKYNFNCHEYDTFIEAFVSEYAPHVSYDKLKYKLTVTHPVEYIGLPDLVTL